MRDAAGQLADRLQPLGETQRLLDPLALGNLTEQLGIGLGEFPRPLGDPCLERLVQLAERVLGGFLLPAGAPFGERPHDGARQSIEALLRHVIGGTALQRLDGDVLAEGAGDEDEGDVGAGLAGDGEGAQAVEGWGGLSGISCVGGHSGPEGGS